jgi:creatinine amidohydrolase
MERSASPRESTVEVNRKDLVMRNVLTLLALLFCTACAWAQQLSVRWEELTAEDFRSAIQQSQGTCLLPFGILEKHGPHMPLGTDLLNVRHAALAAAQQEFAVVYPEYYFGQIFEARHEPGTVAYSSHLQLELLQETTDEMARNGCKKVIIVNGHGGNEHLLPFFAQTQLERAHDYVVYIFGLPERPAGGPPRKTSMDMHAGENETSTMLISRPDLVHIDRAGKESGADQARMALPDTLYTGIWWYARFPEHYSGDGSAATRELGEYDMQAWIASIAKAIQAVKSDKTSLQLQNEFFEKAKHPLETPQ